MKNLILILTFLISCKNLIAQESSLTKNKVEWFESGQKYLKKGKLEIAVSQFNMAYKYDKNSDIQILARKKNDSLLPIIYKKIIQEWRGNWKIKELHRIGHSAKFSEYILIGDDKIVFYQKDLKGKETIIRSELIKFFPLDSMKTFYSLRKVIFENSEIWSFETDKKKSQKRLYPTLERDSSRRGYMLIDERSFITDRKLRKEALKKEIYTFYVKVE
ncbi:hypothetical protein V5J73_10100 [Flavobacterium sp. KS-LB2]|uniref:hypothetical protein n=1 Tax=Flavobacterium sp. KS-LB2 TaxID=3120525 RepID=UPI0030D10605